MLNCCINNDMAKQGKFSVCETCGHKMKRIDYITEDCFRTKKEYTEFLKLVEEEKKSNIIIEKKNPLDKILERRK